jgi:hypothetical protein
VENNFIGGIEMLEINKIVSIPKDYCVQYLSESNTWRIYRDPFGIFGMSKDEAEKLAERKCLEGVSKN